MFKSRVEVIMSCIEWAGLTDGERSLILEITKKLRIKVTLEEGTDKNEQLFRD